MPLLRSTAVILYMGDNAGDFPIGTKGKTLVERNAIIDEHKEDFGTTFVVFPNPAYGSWVSALAKGYQNLSPEEQKQVNNQLPTTIRTPCVYFIKYDINKVYMRL